jgi:hypothetical protein
MGSRKHERCIGCGTTEIKHTALGLCQICYGRYLEARHTGYKGRAEKRKNVFIETRTAVKNLSGNFLIEEYLNKGRSLSDMANECGCLVEDVYRKIVTYKLYDGVEGLRALN